jgi:hypothetical protein
VKTIIAGSRSITGNKEKSIIFDALDIYFNKGLPTEVVSGCARGVDTIGAEWAIKNGVPVKKFQANWEKHGRAAGPIRNQEMANYSEQALIFWDGKSRGAKHMAEAMKKLKKPYYLLWTP